MNAARLRRRRQLRAALGGVLLLSAAAAACLWAARDTGTVLARTLPQPDELAPAAALEAASETCAPATAAASDAASTSPRAARLEARLASLARELENPRFQPRVLDDRLHAALDDWSTAEDDELAARLAGGLADDAELVALASLARERGLALAAPVRARLSALAFRGEGALGLSLESARTLLALGGADDVARWCELLEDGRAQRERLVAAYALGAVRQPAALRALVGRACEIASTRSGARLFDALQHALANHEPAFEADERQRLGQPLAVLAEDAQAAADVRARALGALARLDPARAAQQATGWLLDPRTDAAGVERACAVLRAEPGLARGLDAALADESLGEARRARLAECLLAAGTAAEPALARLRATLDASTDSATRRRVLHALAAYGDDEDRARVAGVAENDRDALVRAAAQTSLARATSEWR